MRSASNHRGLLLVNHDQRGASHILITHTHTHTEAHKPLYPSVREQTGPLKRERRGCVSVLEECLCVQEHYSSTCSHSSCANSRPSDKTCPHSPFPHVQVRRWRRGTCAAPDDPPRLPHPTLRSICGRFSLVRIPLLCLTCLTCISSASYFAHLGNPHHHEGPDGGLWDI